MKPMKKDKLAKRAAALRDNLKKRKESTKAKAKDEKAEKGSNKI